MYEAVSYNIHAECPKMVRTIAMSKWHGASVCVCVYPNMSEYRWGILYVHVLRDGVRDDVGDVKHDSCAPEKRCPR